MKSPGLLNTNRDILKSVNLFQDDSINEISISKKANIDIAELDSRINDLVFELYDFSDEEKAILLKFRTTHAISL